MGRVGVGGTGVSLASENMGEIGTDDGYEVKKSDSIGMAQRGGSVVIHVRWGKHIFSPLIKKGEVDFLLGFEQLETARWAPYLKSDGIAIVSDVTIVPVSVIGGNIPYPHWDEVKEILAQYTDEIYLLPATRIGTEVGTPRARNVVMLGSLSIFLALKAAAWTAGSRHK